MPVKIRLTRMGKKKQPSYRVVVIDSRKPRDGAYIEQIGRYDPRQEPSLIEINNERALDWLNKGAQPTDRAKKLLEISGAWTRFRIAKGDIHTVGEATPPTAPAPAEPVADTPEPDTPEPDTPEPGTPEPEAPAPETPAPETTAEAESEPETSAETDAAPEAPADEAADAADESSAVDDADAEATDTEETP